MVAPSLSGHVMRPVRESEEVNGQAQEGVLCRCVPLPGPAWLVEIRRDLCCRVASQASGAPALPGHPCTHGL